MTKPHFTLSGYWRNILEWKRSQWLRDSLHLTFGFKKYVTDMERGQPLLRVLEAARIPRLIAQPELAKTLRKNMGWIGRYLGYRFIQEPFMAEDTISAIDWAIKDDWKNPTPPTIHE